MDRRTLEDYGAMMEDKIRMAAYEQAIAAVCPDKVVCELGVGLAPLSLMALKAGAKRVYGVELNKEALELATRVMAANGYDGTRFIPIGGLSTQTTLPEPVDVILSETLDSMGIGENTAMYMADARKRMLAPDGCFLPDKLQVDVALASPRAYIQAREFWTKTMPEEHGMSYDLVAEEFKNCKHTLAVTTDELFSPWTLWQSMDFMDDSSFRGLVPMALPVTRAGTILGFACAFDARLSEGVHIRTYPEDAPTHWFQGFNAFPQPIEARAGDVVYMELDVAAIDHPSIKFDMRVVCGSSEEVNAFVQNRARELAAGRR